MNTDMETHYPEKAVRVMIEALVARAGSQKAFAQKVGMSPAYINDVIHGRREISAELASRVGLRRVTCFVVVDDGGEK